MRRLTAATALVAVAFMAATPAEAGGRPVRWHRAGASTFGGPCEPSETIGYRGAYLPKLWRSYAELDMGTALGGLPNNALLRVLNPRTHRKITIRKRDIGLGGGSVFGVHRKIDLYWRVTHYLDRRASCNSWTGVVLYRRIYRPIRHRGHRGHRRR